LPVIHVRSPKRRRLLMAHTALARTEIWSDLPCSFHAPKAPRAAGEQHRRLITPVWRGRRGLALREPFLDLGPASRQYLGGTDARGDAEAGPVAPHVAQLSREPLVLSRFSPEASDALDDLAGVAHQGEADGPE
jgi:hypothetical protein